MRASQRHITGNLSAEHVSHTDARLLFGAGRDTRTGLMYVQEKVRNTTPGHRRQRGTRRDTVPGMLCLLEDMVCSGPERSFVFPYGPSSKQRHRTKTFILKCSGRNLQSSTSTTHKSDIRAVTADNNATIEISIFHHQVSLASLSSGTSSKNRLKMTFRSYSLASG